jgi:hypothetical protein
MKKRPYRIRIGRSEKRAERSRITQERLMELFTYEEDTGLFIRNIRVANHHAGEIAGAVNYAGYIIISIDDRLYRAHQLAWLYKKGVWPAKFIDHDDLDKSNNRWVNLREATKGQNHANRPLLATSTSGLKGAYRYKAGASYGKPWQAGIRKDGKQRHLGHFATKEEAHAAYVEAAQKIHGEYARAA